MIMCFNHHSTEIVHNNDKEEWWEQISLSEPSGSYGFTPWLAIDNDWEVCCRDATFYPFTLKFSETFYF